MSKRKRSSPEEEGGGYSWMDTYGDMVTLLLCFFVLLFSFSSMDAEKWKDLVGAFSGSTVVSISALDPGTVRQPEVTAIDGVEPSEEEEKDEDKDDGVGEESPQFIELFFKIQSYIQENGLSAELEVQKNGEVILLTFLDRLLFNSGKADIISEGKPIMQEVVKMLGENMNSIAMIRIEGHTDNMPIHTFEFDSNWELSAKRAVNVLRLYADSNVIDKDKISAIGYGEYHPIETNDTDEGRARNRRVDIIVESIYY